ncbi:hypothetical protein L1987_01843 [Smallanthus sonchifolius]|uniref:Uncharacterized protein n=1 Tax=Smallanthus sonchifolius TaxID=185202 RepID=A0ACB9K635_9ASTR|nr:hypothetical protein L1987_01843 [Smallanthus sonchifolius]
MNRYFQDLPLKLNQNQNKNSHRLIYSKQQLQMFNLVPLCDRLEAFVVLGAKVDCGRCLQWCITYALVQN